MDKNTVKKAVKKALSNNKNEIKKAVTDGVAFGTSAIFIGKDGKMKRINPCNL